jgi:hypothetical protein
LQQPSSTTIGLATIPQTGHIPLLAGMYALGLALFLAVEPTKPWLLIPLAGLVALGTDGIVRSHPKSISRDALDTAPYLLVPTILVLASGFFLEDTVVGYWSLVAAIVAGAMMAAALYGEYVSVDIESAMYPLARFILNVVAYLAAFALYAVVYSFEVDLLPAALCAGLVSLVLGAEILRETELMPPPAGQASLRALGFAAAIGLVVAEARWALYFIPLDGFLAAVFLLLVFYVASGIIQHYLTARLSWAVVLEFAIVASLGLVMVILGSSLTDA